jgi:hypothetical protein
MIIFPTYCYYYVDDLVFSSGFVRQVRRVPLGDPFFFLCGHEKNNFPRLLTCNTVENGVPIDESGVQQQHSSLEREREKPKNVAHDPL